MVKFAHISDCHLGSWRQEGLRDINFKSFQMAVDLSIAEKVDFIIIAGDLFDSAYPPIEVLKDSFAEFKKIREAGIPIYLVAGSHDFSASGKTFLDVMERSGFCKNVESFEILEDGRMKLKPSFYKDIAIYGYPGRKSGMEVEDLKKITFDYVAPFTIFMLHSTIKDVVGNIPMESIEKEKLPLADYYAMGHIHKRFETRLSNSVFVYPGPTYPNNFQELVDLKCGSFNLVEVSNGKINTRNITLPIKEVVFIEVELTNGFTATQEIINELDKHNLNNKILLLKLKGLITSGKTADISFNEIEDFAKKKGVFEFLRNISFLRSSDGNLVSNVVSDGDMEGIERKIREEYTYANPDEFNKYLPDLMSLLSIEKNEDEKISLFEDRLVKELKNILEISEVF